ncbi:sugar ABC transporter substrate-binding protein [Halocynthiibacter sp. C4]|uniref:ABC transporter substrate-binding protein n=1 Tax=Halocynthiibacter sp. C4 TaxID=2992758 RepID=UPI00237BD312|nr:sugar ABC transporter substrate-binding protein [Halocynthiibacter sp. C4]MDE0591570.1 sugar ABC transporter substrate-binding protein [Halocynthiibacter sp. C4]
MLKLKKAALTSALALGTAVAATTASAETLSFVTWQKTDAAYGAWWAEAVETFEAQHPGVTIEMTQVGRKEYADTLFTMFAGGTPPDIVHLAAFEYQPFAEEGWIEPLGPWIEKSGLDLTGWAGQPTCERNGETYCLMLFYAGFVMAYNEELLKAAGWDTPPTTFEEYIAAAEAITGDSDGDGIVDKYGVGLSMTEPATVMHQIQGFALDSGGDWTRDGKPIIDDPATVEGFAKWKSIVQAGLTPQQAKGNDLRQLMIEGNLGMYIDGPWIYGVLNKASEEMRPKLKITYSPLSPPLGGTSNIITMPSEISDERKALVWDFIEIIASEDFQNKFADYSGNPAPRPGLDYADNIEADATFETFIEATRRAAEAKVDRLPKGLELYNSQLSKVIFTETQRMLAEDLDPAQVAATIQEKVLAFD